MKRQGTAMSERRIDERTLVGHLLQVRERDSQEVLGNLVNLSTNGFMLISESPHEPNREMALTMELPYSVSGRQRLDVRARCIWSQKSSYSDDYGAGFEITEIAESDRELMRNVFGE